MKSTLNHMAMTLALLGLGAMGAQAQYGSSSGSQSSGSSGRQSGSGTPGSYGSPSGSSSSGTYSSTDATRSADMSGGTLNSSDRKFVEEVAKGGLKEVELGKLAEQKASNSAVKDFGKKMAKDHEKTNDELKSHMKNWGVSAPASLDAKDQAEKDRLSKLSGAEFDREYMSHMVADHRKDVSEFQKHSSSASNADLKSFASKTLPTLQEHLRLAEQTHAQVGGASGTSGASASSSGSSSPTRGGSDR
jgi:putative membrane protein